MSYISVVMSTCNAKDYIAESIESVLKQSFSDFELIVVNDSSTDNNINSIICSYHDKRIRLIDNDIKDHIQSLNLGIKASTGKYIARMNAGNIMHVDRLKIQYSIMEEYPDITVCSCWETVFGEKMQGSIREQKISGWIELPLVQLLLDDIIINPVYTIRRSFITEHGLLFENYGHAEDYKFWVETAKLNGGFYIDSQPLVYRRISDAKIPEKSREEHVQSISTIKKEILYFLNNKYCKKYPALTTLYNSYYELLSQNLIFEDDIFKLFHSLFMKNMNTFKSFESNQKIKKVTCQKKK